MTEAEILLIRGDLTGLVLSIFSVSFGMISAYTAGLWLFLRHAPFLLRLVTFGVLSFGLAFMGAIAFGMHQVLLGTDAAWRDLEAPATQIIDFGGRRPEFLQGLSYYEASSGLGFLAFAAVYLVLFVMTFFYRWKDRED
ncbi:MAG: hypothetical protein AAFZ01_01595 [Pseudomonadota bacterium]